ncbi:DUF885 domain-containing protein [Sphingosinicella terrae]|uniref:DUF885 domain-containing protein n=1 Tax=Sphingosinicella terrae TaxID=2172047 RepID=UPI000E0DAA37|nr:DUF885 family protein [Sphingosinicella terrae]
MDRRTFIAALGATSGLAMLGGAPARAAFQAATAGSADAALSALLDRMFFHVMETNPEFATMLGLDTGERAGLRSRLSDYSPQSQARELAAFRSFAVDLDAIDRSQLSEASRLHRDAVTFLTASAIEGLAEFPYGSNAIGYVPYVISQQDGAYQSIPDFLDQHHRISGPEDAVTYLARLEAFAIALDQNSDKQREDAARGVFAPGFILSTTLDQLRALRGVPAAQSVLVTSLGRKARDADLAGDHARRAEAIVTEQVYPALDRQIALVEELRGRATSDAGVWRLPQGEAYYAASVHAATTTDMSPEEVHQLGLAQVAEISGRLAQILSSQGINGADLTAQLATLNSDPRQLYPNTDAGREQLLADLNRQIEQVDALLPRAFASRARAEVQVVRVPELIQDGASNGYYQPAPFDLSRPANYYINLKDTHDWPKYGLPSLTYHEAMPGHHLQISLAQESRDTPMLLKLSPFGAYTEGWALYAETLADELGVYENDPLGRAGMLQSLLFRAARLVVDTGLHHKRWSREQATDYMVRTTGFPVPRTQREIDRYCASPGQACSYKVGHTVWVRLRGEAQAALGDRFDLRQFHQILLKGALPLTILEQEVDRWVAAQRA